MELTISEILANPENYVSDDVPGQEKGVFSSRNWNTYHGGPIKFTLTAKIYFIYPIFCKETGEIHCNKVCSGFVLDKGNKLILCSNDLPKTILSGKFLVLDPNRPNQDILKMFTTRGEATKALETFRAKIASEKKNSEIKVLQEKIKGLKLELKRQESILAKLMEE